MIWFGALIATAMWVLSALPLAVHLFRLIGGSPPPRPAHEPGRDVVDVWTETDPGHTPLFDHIAQVLAADIDAEWAVMNGENA